MNLGENYIHKAYYGTQELTPSTAYLGEVPLIEDLQPDLWYPFNTDLLNYGKQSAVNASNISSNMAITAGIGAKSNGPTTAACITNWNVPYSVFISQHTYQSVTYPPTDITVSCWIKINYDEMKSWVANSFGSKSLSTTGNGCVIGTMDAAEFFGIVCRRDEINSETGLYDLFKIYLGGRNGSARQFYPICTVPWDTWIHVAFTYDVANNYVKCFFNGQKVSSGQMIAYSNWEWTLRTLSWVTLIGSYHAENYPFYYKDVRIYGRCISEGGIKYIYDENLWPEVWFPFDIDLVNYGKLNPLTPTLTDYSTIDNDMTLLSDGSKASGSRGIVVTNSENNYTIFTADRTYDGQTIPANEVSASLFIKLRSSDLQNRYPNRTLAKEVIYGYYYESSFYSDEEHQNIITPTEEAVYIDTPNNNTYHWVDNSYIQLTWGSWDQNGMILGSEGGGYSFFGFYFRSTDENSSITFQRQDVYWGNRYWNEGQDIAVFVSHISLDEWLHLAFTYNPDTKLVKVYVNGRLISSVYGNKDTVNTEWVLQCIDVRLFDNTRAIRFPFVYKDVRIYSRILKDSEIYSIYRDHSETL